LTTAADENHFQQYKLICIEWLKGVDIKNYGTKTARMVIIAPKIKTLGVFQAAPYNLNS
jgi:hypothetical protein